jgi:rhodanese-related sulfurtransferase
MTVGQIFLYVIITLFILYSTRRLLQRAHMKEYSASEIPRLLTDNSIILLDVRTNQERTHSHIKGSLHIPLGLLQERMQSLEKYIQKEIVCYCQSGNRSRAAVSILRRNGFHAANLKGGIAEWNYLH